LSSSRFYFDAQGRPALQPSLCVYMDVLGIRGRMTTARPWEGFDGPEPPKDLAGFHQVLAPEIRNLRDRYLAIGEHPDWEVKAFSDNVVIGFPVPNGDGWHEFGWLMDLISGFQCSLTLEGYFVRGAIDFGYLFMDDVTVYGPALVEAYELERHLAIGPRIVLSDRIRAQVDRHLETFVPRHMAPHNRSLLVDSDGVVFVNYLNDLVGPEIVADDHVEWDSIATHKSEIERNLTAHKTEPRIWSKYLWASTYHDFFVDWHRGYPGYSDAYRIEPALAPRTVRRLVPWPST
jgi:hypothetical protein